MLYGHRYGHILSVLVPNRFGAGQRLDRSGRT